MSKIISQMTGVAIGERLQEHMLDLEAAILADNIEKILAADHALRNDAMALLGVLSINDRTSGSILDMLENVSASLRQASARLSARSVGEQQNANRNLVYLKVSSMRKSGE